MPGTKENKITQIEEKEKTLCIKKGEEKKKNICRELKMGTWQTSPSFEKGKVKYFFAGCLLSGTQNYEIPCTEDTALYGIHTQEKKNLV